MTIMSIGKTMKASISLANPKFPSVAAAAALFHSTPHLCVKKRVYWPERSSCRGPPRPRFKLGIERSHIADIIEKLNEESQTSWNWRAHEDKRAKDSSSSKHSGNSSSKSYTSSKSSNIASPDTTSDRLALGLSATGPLNLENLKTAYRACAVKWHPDHHHGFAKAFAEEKFKICNAAYQSLCNKLSTSLHSDDSGPDK